MHDLDAAVGRITQLDDRQLAEFVAKLDAALADCHHGAGGDDPNILAVAALARIALRRRRDAAAMARAVAIVNELISATETTE
ncbi:hypothetical protein [Streptomyces sp. PH10-H1]|uniref:hypothetical protein n=1 Tax=Streptomyces sp. PH10-H1 TaxID=3046212 RepID=UPI0024BA6D10|nr:hypothetical protein [Streptomyces sp. PH10-H1]MDJ0341775.1 hypothetical protein [Streptomyces sp. PH10-H1]